MKLTYVFFLIFIVIISGIVLKVLSRLRAVSLFLKNPREERKTSKSVKVTCEQRCREPLVAWAFTFKQLAARGSRVPVIPTRFFFFFFFFLESRREGKVKQSTTTQMMFSNNYSRDLVFGVTH